MKKLLLLLFTAAVPAQVISTPTGCPGQICLTCPSGSTPLGFYVDFDVASVVPGTLVSLWFGSSSDPTVLPLGLPLPFDMGLLYPSLTGCMLHTSMVADVVVIAQHTTARVPVFLPNTIAVAMATPLIFDGRNALNPAELTALGFRYVGVGR